MNLKSFFKRFHNEQACRDFLTRERWPDGIFQCPYCQHTRAYKIEGGRRFKCAGCAKKFSCTTGTVMQNTKLPLSTWLAAMYILSNSKKGVSSIQLAAHLGVTQKTAWFLIHRIRESWAQDKDLVLGQKDAVEGDVTWIGGKVRNKSLQKRYEYAQHRDWRQQKVPVLGLVERNGKALLRAVSREGEETPIIRHHTELYSSLYTDDAAHYISLKDDYYHHTVSHAKNEYGRWKINTNTVEGMFAHLKRMYKGTYHSISPKHLQKYCDEFIYRHNNRLLSNEERFKLAVRGLPGKLTYKMLVHGKSDEKDGQKGQ